MEKFYENLIISYYLYVQKLGELLKKMNLHKNTLFDAYASINFSEIPVIDWNNSLRQGKWSMESK